MRLILSGSVEMQRLSCLEVEGPLLKLRVYGLDKLTKIISAQSIEYVICANSEMRSSSHGSMQLSVDGIPHSQSSAAALDRPLCAPTCTIQPARCPIEAVNFRPWIPTPILGEYQQLHEAVVAAMRLGVIFRAHTQHYV